MIRLHRLIPLIALAAGLSAHARPVYVDQNASGTTHDGLSWATAFLRVADGLAVATSEDEVRVARGTYLESVTLGSKQSMYGGFAGTETQREQRDWKANPTVLDGGTSGLDVVTCGFRTVVDGFGIRHGQNGITVAAGATATLANNTIADNGYDGVYVDSASALLSSSTISGAAVHGVQVHLSTVAVTGATVSANRRFGIAMTSGTLTLTSSTISGNGEAGVWVSSSSATLNNSTITANAIGVDVYQGSARLTNSIVAFNSGLGLLVEEGGSLPTFISNDIYGNAGGDYFGYTPPEGQGNISVDPKLSNPYHDVHIQPDSPCRDAGDTAAATGATDIDGQPRVQGAAVDLGSDESDGTVWAVPSITWHVSPGGDDAFDGRSWAAAKQTITGALATAQAGDEVWVAGGVYDQAVSPGPWLALYGGFAGTETGRDQRDWNANPTILDGGGRSGPVVTCAFGSTRVDGFSIRNGVTGILLSGYATGTVTHNVLTGNGDHGIYVDRRTSVTLAENASFGNGKDGIGILGTATVSNNTVAGNGRDGLYASYGKATLINNIVAFNGSYGVESVSGATVTLRRNDVYANAQNLSYNVFPNPRDGNLMRDPLFADRAGLDFRLTLGSPCRGAGDDSAVASGETDLDGRPRILGAHVDMGAYEYDASGLAPFFLPDVAKALGIAAGLIASSPDDVSRLNVEPTSAGVDIRDASRVARKVAGLDPNP